MAQWHEASASGWLMDLKSLGHPGTTNSLETPSPPNPMVLLTFPNPSLGQTQLSKHSQLIPKLSSTRHHSGVLGNFPFNAFSLCYIKGDGRKADTSNGSPGKLIQYWWTRLAPGLPSVPHLQSSYHWLSDPYIFWDPGFQGENSMAKTPWATAPQYQPRFWATRLGRIFAAESNVSEQ